MTYQARGARGWLIAGVAGLCVAAGGGGYAISQMSRADGGPREPHVQAPLPRDEAEAPAPATAPPAVSAAAAPAAGAAPQAPAPPPATPAAPGAAARATPGSPGAPATDAAPVWRPTTPAPTIADRPTDATAARKPADPAPGDARPASPRLVDSKHPAKAVTSSTGGRPATRSGDDKPAKPEDARPAAKPIKPRPDDAKPAAKPTKSKSDDALYKDRR